MNGVSDNQSNRSILDAFWRTANLSRPRFALRPITHSLSSKKFIIISVGTLAFGIPAIASSLYNSSSDSSSSTSKTSSQNQEATSNKVELNQQSSSNTSNALHTNLTINGESIPVSENSSIHKVISSDHQDTNITVDTQHQQTENSVRTSSSVNMSTQTTNKEGGEP